MITFRSFLNKTLSIFHKFFSPSMFHKKTIDSRGIKYVGHLTRFTAIIIDLIIYVLILYFIATCINALFSFSLPLEIVERYKLGLEIGEEEQNYINKYIFVIFSSQVLQFAVIAFCNIYMWHKYGCTPSKFITGIIILDENTLKPPTIKQSIKRFFALIISILPIFLGVIWVIFDKKGQAWHDKIAGTIVIAKSSLSKNTSYNEINKQKCV